MWKAGAQSGEASRQVERHRALVGPSAAGRSHLALVSAPPTLAKALQFKGHHRGGPCPYPHLIWPDPGLAAKSSLSCQHRQQQLHRQPCHSLPFPGLCPRLLGVSMEAHTHSREASWAPSFRTGLVRHVRAEGALRRGASEGTKEALRANRGH